MKKVFLLNLLLVSLFTHQAMAGDKAADVFKTFRFGLFAGPTINSMRPVVGSSGGYNVTKEGGKLGFSFGLTADYRINEHYTFYTGLGMDWRGGKINAQIPEGGLATIGYLRGANVAYTTQYITVPAGLRMNAVTFDNVKIQALAGIDLGILLSAKGNYTLTFSDTVAGGGYRQVTREKESLTSTARVVPINLGWNIGVGGEYDLNGNNAVTLYLVYRNGFIDITTPQNNTDGNRFKDGNIRSNAFDIKLGYTF